MIRVSAPTYDEPVHLASGYAALRNGVRLLNYRDHPPLAEMWAALPLLVLRPATMFQHPAWLQGMPYTYSDLFLYKNRVDPERMLDTARLWSLISWGALLAGAVCAWAYSLAGLPAAGAGALLLGLCPPLFTNAALVTTDTGSAVFFFLTFFLLRGSGRRSRARWLAAGAAMGAAMACKFNMFILPFFVAAMLLAEWNLGRRQGARFPTAGLAWAGLACGLVLAAAYRIYNVPLYWEGLSATLARLGQGRASFLFGAHPSDGRLLYFPAALLLKTPLPLLLTAGLGVWAWAKNRAALASDRERFLAGIWLTVPPAVYFLLACFSRTQIGYRHILPVYPFLVVAGAAGAAWLLERRSGQVAAALLAAWLGVSLGRCHPHYLAYFNEAGGGPDQGYRWLVDSNLDWGQGLKPLAQELRALGDPPVILCYFGVADPSYYGIKYLPVGFVDNVDRREGVVAPGPDDRVLFAVSATNLQTTYFADHSLFDWLKARRPLSRPGRSIFLYDLSSDPEGIQRLAGLVEAAGYKDVALKLRQRHVKTA